MSMSRILALLCSCCILLFTALAHADDHHLGVADYLDFEQVSDPQISPDGSQVIYTRRWVDQKADRWSSALWIMDADGINPTQVTRGAPSRAPSWRRSTP